MCVCQVGCFAEAIDSFGAASSATSTVRVLPEALSVAELRNESEAKAAEAISSQDADAAKQVLAMTTDLIATTIDAATAAAAAAGGQAGGGGRRSLLASGDNAALRASVLANLWATYAITPVTQADMASLLNNLLGVVDTPDEVDENTAEGSLNFLQTVRIV